MKRILLIYPTMGMSGSLVRHIPLSLLYASKDSIEAGFQIDIVDARLDAVGWRKNIASKISGDTILVGISVMTGSPIQNALDISRWVKSNYPLMNVVWGGPHCTFNGADVLNEPSIDFVVAGYGSRALAALALNLSMAPAAPALSSISGLIYRENGVVNAVKPDNSFEFIDYRQIPYHLVENNLSEYGQLGLAERIFPMYSAMGCPYNCAFCSSPAQYRDIRKKYVPLSAPEVVDHIEFVQSKYGATYIYFIDDDSFVRLDHVESIIDEINKRGVKIGLGFRGARVNEIKRMSDEFLSKLARAGTNIMHIGAESGSQRILDLIKKDCDVDDIIEINRKMAHHQEIKTAYNWIVGLPGETLDDLRQTQQLIIKLLEENKAAIIFLPNKFRPLPGTELYDLAIQYGYNRPARLEDWVNTEAEGDYSPPWYTKEISSAINMMQVASYFVDNKALKLETGRGYKYRFAKFATLLYGPIARARLRSGYSGMLGENIIFRFFSRLYQK